MNNLSFDGIKVREEILKQMVNSFQTNKPFVIVQSLNLRKSLEFPREILELEDKGFIKSERSEENISLSTHGYGDSPHSMSHHYVLTDKCRKLYQDVMGSDLEVFQKSLSEKEIFTALADILIHGQYEPGDWWNGFLKLFNSVERNNWHMTLRILQSLGHGTYNQETHVFTLKHGDTLKDSDELAKKIIYQYAKIFGHQLDHLTDEDRELVRKSNGDCDFRYVCAENRSHYQTLMRLAILLNEFYPLGRSRYYIPSMHVHRILDKSMSFPTQHELDQIPTGILPI